MTRPTRNTTAGRAYLALRAAARQAGRTTNEYLRLYTLEGFLLRLSLSPLRDRFVLKGGVLMAAHAFRRPTADVDMAGLYLSNGVDEIRRLVVEIAAFELPKDADDGLVFDTDSATAETIRDQDQYSGVRVKLTARLATARESFHVDINVGDPIWPVPSEVQLPRLIDRDPVRLRGYPVEMIVAEKLVTAVQRGIANTRWRDFGDLFQLSRRVPFSLRQLGQAVIAVADHRRAELVPLDTELSGFADLGQAGWTGWLNRNAMADDLPGSFAEVLAAVATFADPVLAGTAGDGDHWDPPAARWAPGDAVPSSAPAR